MSNANRAWRARATTKRGPRYFTAETKLLSDKQRAWFFETFGYWQPELLYAPYLDRFVYTVRGPTGSHRGVIARSFSGAMPKSLTYKYLDEPFLGWAGEYGQEPLVVVEDWVSAEKVAEAGFRAVALNGTLLDQARAHEIGSLWSGAQIVLAFDNDAFGKALVYQQQFPALNLKVARLWLDLKFEPLEKIKKVFQSGHYDFIAT